MSNIEYQAIINFFTRQGLNATEINEELDSIYKGDAPFYHTVAKRLAECKESERAFEDSSQTGRPSSITTDENVEALEQIGMRDRKISVRVLAHELAFPTTTVYEIMSNHLDMKEVSTR